MTVTETRESSYLVTVSSGVRFQLEEELNRCRFLLAESKETGGLLFGTVTEDRIDITLATGPGDDFTPQTNEVDLNPSRVLGEEARVVGDFVIGSWHAHPRPGVLDAPNPSYPEDFNHWEFVLDRSRENAVVGLIVTHGRVGGWRSPRLFAWVTHRKEGATVAERIGELHAR